MRCVGKTLSYLLSVSAFEKQQVTLYCGNLCRMEELVKTDRYYETKKSCHTVNIKAVSVNDENNAQVITSHY